MKSSRILKTVISIVALLLVVLLLCGFVAYFVKGDGRDRLDDLIGVYMVSYGDTYFRENESYELILPADGDVTFTINNAQNVSVKVLPNTDFEYKVDGEVYHFADIGDLTKYFIKNDNVFADHLIIECEKDVYTLQNLLRSVYGAEAQLELPDSYDLYLYKIVFTYGKHVIEISFFQEFEVPVEGITLSDEEIVF